MTHIPLDGRQVVNFGLFVTQLVSPFTLPLTKACYFLCCLCSNKIFPLCCCNPLPSKDRMGTSGAHHRLVRSKSLLCPQSLCAKGNKRWWWLEWLPFPKQVCILARLSLHHFTSPLYLELPERWISGWHHLWVLGWWAFLSIFCQKTFLQQEELSKKLTYCYT